MSETQKANIKALVDVALNLNENDQDVLLRLGKDLLFIDEVKRNEENRK